MAANALYALVAERLGKLYDRKDFSESSARIRVQLRSVYEKVKGSKQELFTMYPFLSDSLSLKEGELCKNGVYCGYMLDRDPGTFWESLSGTDSRNHGFGSYYGVFAVRDFLGLGIPDRTERKIRFAPGIGSLKWAKGSILTADGRICASFSREEDKLRLCMSAPEGYRIEVEIPKEYCFYEEMQVNGRTESFRRHFTEGNIVPVELGHIL